MRHLYRRTKIINVAQLYMNYITHLMHQVHKIHNMKCIHHQCVVVYTIFQSIQCRSKHACFHLFSGNNLSPHSIDPNKIMVKTALICPSLGYVISSSPDYSFFLLCWHHTQTIAIFVYKIALLKFQDKIHSHKINTPSAMIQP